MIEIAKRVASDFVNMLRKIRKDESEHFEILLMIKRDLERLMRAGKK